MNVIVILMVGIAIAVSLLFVIDYYREEKKRKQQESKYRLYKIIFEKESEIYTQIIGAVSEYEAEQLFYQQCSEKNVEILEITDRII